MKMVPYDYRKIEKPMFYKKTKNDEILDGFLESGETCVELVGYTHVSSKCCQNSILTRIRKRKMKNMVKVMIRGDQVFLVRIDKIENAG